MSGTKVATCLWSHNNTGAEQVQFYANVFGENCKVTNPTGVMVTFELFGQSYQVLNGGPHHRLSECVSISVTVDEQAEVDRLWTALTADGGKPMECGWLKDRFDLCWQIIPSAFPRLMKKGGAVAEAVFKAMMSMTKFDAAVFEAAAAAAEAAQPASAAESTDKKRSSPEDAEAQASKK